MGDRKNPIKFGPEWLRNLSRERSTGSTDNSQNVTGSSTRPAGTQGSNSSTAISAEAGGTGNSTVTSVASTSSLASTLGGISTASASSPCGTNTRNTNPNSHLRVRLANRRYGREEMLALCDKTADPPEELKHFELLYQPREKLPLALNTFEEEVRDNHRTNPPIGAMSGERFGAARNSPRGVTGNESRGRSRMPFVRNPVGSSRGMNPLHVTNTRLPGYNTGPDEEANSARSWTNSNGSGTPNRNSEPFRRRQTNQTNWRQTSRDDGDEWRPMENVGRHSRNLDKWDRDWTENDRRQGAQERPQPWSANRRAWNSGESQNNTNNDNNLPEWAIDNAEAGAGTFDSSGAFHGYTNEVSTASRSPENPYPMVRSHAIENLANPKPEEQSKEWWSSEKANKLSPKRFDVGDGRPKKTTSVTSNESQASTSSQSHSTTAEEANIYADLQDVPQKLDESTSELDERSPPEDTQQQLKKFSESKTFDAMMRPEMAFPESTEERGNFQSVMITPNNGLRQKHQNIVNASNDPQGHSTDALYQILHGLPLHSPMNDDMVEAALVNDLVELSLNEGDLPPTNMPGPSSLQQMQIASPVLQPPAMQSHSMAVNSASALPVPLQNMGMQNQAHNSQLGLVISPEQLLQGQLPPVLQNAQMQNPMEVVGRFQANFPVPALPTLNLPSNSLFMGHNNRPALPPAMPLPNQEIPNNIFPIGMQRPNVENNIEIYNNVMPQLQAANLADQWYYEDPKKVIQGPFTSREMRRWYQAGFFGPSLMVRRAFEAHMRPLGSYNPDMQAYQMPLYDLPGQPAHDMLNQGRRVNIGEALWGHANNEGQEFLWMQRRTSNEDAVNNLPMYFWDPQPTGNSMNLPADIVKEMKTEDEILAQLRATQNIPPPQSAFPNDSPPTTTSSSTTISTSDDNFNVGATPDLEKLQQLIQNETLTPSSDTKSESGESETKSDVPDKPESTVETTAIKTQTLQNKSPSEPKSNKAKNESEKPTKVKDSNNVPKTKNKKPKEEKKEELDNKNKEEIKSEKASVESSPTKSKKEEKLTKKELEKEKKEWIKEGFTIVKGPEKNVNKENKKKAEEAKVAEEIEKKKKEEEKVASDEEKKKKQADTVKKQQQRQLSESLSRRAWDLNAQAAATNKAGLTLSEIQRLEREKKLEQIKEQQHMMHLIAQQQAAALAREQEMQANLAWAKNNLSNNGAGPSLAEIQAETRRQSAAAAAAATQSIEEVIPLPPLPTNLVPWGHSTNGGGFWDTQPATPKSEKPQDQAKSSETKAKKKISVATPKREASPTSEFEAWCSSVLALWRAKIDVPTFVGFLKDIESPYEVKDYVKCYLGDSKDSNDFARQFLERRSKLLRVGMVTPSDDLCSPAMAVNPRSALSDFQEVKGKGKKSKKNKMLKVDARILGFSVTAAEDRINVGDIDTA